MKKLLLQFVFSAAVYCSIEIASRGRSHWTMALTGGLCGVALFAIADYFERYPIWVQGVIGAAFITYAELCVGTCVNLALGWKVWDYHDRWGNIAGQICPFFSIAWFLLSCTALYVIKIVKLKYYTKCK